MNTHTQPETAAQGQNVRDKWLDIHFVLNKTQQERDSAIDQRDELLAAAHKVEAHSYHSNFGNRDDHYVVDTQSMDDLCAAIARVEGKQ